LFERGDRLIEGSTEVGQVVKRGSVDAAGIEVADDESIAFGSAQRIGEHFVRYTVESVVEFLVATTTVPEFGEHSEGPTAANDLDDVLRLLPRADPESLWILMVHG
jgi:hypothetical protein